MIKASFYGFPKKKSGNCLISLDVAGMESFRRIGAFFVRDGFVFL